MMKNLISLAALIFILGCATQKPQDVAYKSIGTIATVTDASMLAWGDYVRAGLAKPSDEAQVKTAYQKYQASMIAVKLLVMTYIDSPDNASKLQNSLAAVSNASGAVVDLVNLFLQKGK